MLPGPPTRLTCPHCGGYKYIESILSGNTFRATYWSDGKNDYPMLPSTSPVQKCPSCGSYFFYGDGQPLSMTEETVKALHKSNDLVKLRTMLDDTAKTWRQMGREADANGFGHLSSPESMEAFHALYSDSLPSKRKAELLMTRLWTFNDEYLRGYNTLPPEYDAIQKEFALKLLELFPRDRQFCAELYREMGDFDKASEIMKAILADGTDEYDSVITRKILERAEAHDRTVFVVIEF